LRDVVDSAGTEVPRDSLKVIQGEWDSAKTELIAVYRLCGDPVNRSRVEPKIRLAF
jgi:hypothetical protein